MRSLVMSLFSRDLLVDYYKVFTVLTYMSTVFTQRLVFRW